MLLESIKDTRGIFGREMFAMVAGVVDLGQPLRGEWIILFPDKNSDGCSLCRQFSGLSAANVSGKLGGEGHLRCESRRRPQQKNRR